jgi:hypothetical protein
VNTLITELTVAMLLWFVVRRLPNLRRLGIARLGALLPVVAVGVAVGFAGKQVTPWPVAATVVAIVVIGLAQVLHVAGPGSLRRALGVGHDEMGLT